MYISGCCAVTLINYLLVFQLEDSMHKYLRFIYVHPKFTISGPFDQRFRLGYNIMFPW